MGNNKRRGGGNKRSKKSSSQRSTPPSTSPAPAPAAPVQETYNVSVNAQEEVEAGGSEEEHLDQAVPEPAEHTTSGSVNMEDSQAELLASNMDDSMYMPVTKLAEEDEKKGSSSDQLEDTGRSYVISPSAYEKTEEHNEEEEGVYLRPDSVAEKEGKLRQVLHKMISQCLYCNHRFEMLLVLMRTSCLYFALFLLLNNFIYCQP